MSHGTPRYASLARLINKARVSGFSAVMLVGVPSCSVLLAFVFCTATTATTLIDAEHLCARIDALLQTSSFCAHLPVEDLAILRGLGEKSEPCLPFLGYILNSHELLDAIETGSDRNTGFWRRLIEDYFIGFAQGNEAQAQEIMDKVVIPACPFSTELEVQVKIESFLRHLPQEPGSMLEPVFTRIFNAKITELCKDASPPYKLQGRLCYLLENYVKSVSWREKLSKYVCAFLENLTTKYFAQPAPPLPEDYDFYHNLGDFAENIYNSMTSGPQKVPSMAIGAIRRISHFVYDGLQENNRTFYRAMIAYASNGKEPANYKVEVQRLVTEALRNNTIHAELSPRQILFLGALKKGSQICQLFLYDIFYDCLILHAGAERQTAYLWSWLIFSSFYEFTQEDPDQARQFLNHAFSLEVGSSKSLEEHCLDFGHDLFSHFKMYKSISLIQASMNGHAATVKYLAEEWGALPSAQNGQALIEASSLGYPRVVAYLIDRSGARFIDYSKDMALIEASQSGHTNIVELLMKSNTPSTDTTDQALFLAAVNRRADTVAFLLSRVSLFSPYAKNQALFFAATLGYTEIVDLLINSGSTFSSYCMRQHFVTAATNGMTSVIRYLMSKGACLFGKDGGYASPIKQQEESQSLCANFDSDTDGAIFDQTLNIALVRAAEGGHSQTVQCLIDSRFEFLTDAKDLALFVASSNGKIATVEVLLNSDMTFSDFAKHLAVLMAIQNNHRKTAGYLKKTASGFFESRQDLELIKAAKSGDSEALQRLIVKGDGAFSECAKDKALFYAAVDGHAQALEGLFMCSFNFGNHAKFQALRVLLGQHTALLKSLINKGVNFGDFAMGELFTISASSGYNQELAFFIENRTAFPKNAIDRALVLAAYNDQVDTLDILLNSNLPFTDYAKDRAFFSAARQKCTRIIERLIASGVTLSSHAKYQALYFLIDHGSIQTAKYLVEKCELSNSALHYALCRLAGHYGLVRLGQHRDPKFHHYIVEKLRAQGAVPPF